MIDLDKTLAELEAFEQLRTFEKWRFFKPYTTQREFIKASTDCYELMLSAGNGAGKTEIGAYIMSRHLTGEYPEWWPGRRWEKPIDVWIAGQTGTTIRETSQLKLFGGLGVEEWGTGYVPRNAILDRKTSRGAADVLDTVKVRHKSGGVSHIAIKTYAQEAYDWQGPRLDLIWLDEEPKEEHYSEALARLTGRNGLIYLTFTPLLGPSNVVKRFIDSSLPTRRMFTMSMDEVTHLSPEEKARKLLEYRPHERGARYHGQVMLGEGAVFTVNEEDLYTDIRLNQVPLHWRKIWGIDFGIQHPFAAVLMAHDPDEDIYYVLAIVKMRDAIPLQHADAIRHIAGNVPIAWPHDGTHREKGSGDQLSTLYRQHGLQMLGEHATHPPPIGGISVYAGIEELNSLIEARRLKVRRELRDWFSEYRTYHYKDGQIVKRDDDVLDATRCAWMMRRRMRAVPLGPVKKGQQKLNPPVGDPRRLAVGTLEVDY